MRTPDDPPWRAGSERHLAAAQRITRCGSWELDLADLGDVDRNALRWSDEVFRIFGYEPGGIEVTNENFFRCVHPDDRDRIRDAVRRALETGATYAIEHRVVRPDGTVRVVQEQSEIQYGEDGRPALMIGTVQDVTDQRVAEEALRRAEQAAVLADRMASLGVIAAGVAHEINNPLAAAIMGIDLLALRRDAVSAAPDQDGIVEDLRANLDRIRHIVADLRIFARGEDGEGVAVDVVHVLESTLRMAGSQIRPRARVVRTYAEVPPVIATEPRLGQVFLNLLLNAAQAIAWGRPEANHVQVATRLDADGRVVIAVGDTGCGIAPDHRSRLYTPFFTTKRLDGGTGLGLSICLRIVADLGGSIDYDTEVGRGTEFRVRLPAAPPDRIPAKSATAALRAPPARILVVDDEAAITNLLSALLRQRHEVVAVASGADALEVIGRGERFDVILCDLVMPGIPGVEVYAELLLRAPDQARRMVAMTAGALTSQARELALHGVPVLDKPIDFGRLDGIVAELSRAPAS